MEFQILEDASELGRVAALAAADKILFAQGEKGVANLILATGASQFEMLQHLVTDTRIDWSNTVMFHLDEYLNMSATHPASFRKYLTERFIHKVAPLGAVYFIEGDAPDSKKECQRISAIIAQHPIDVALIGIGENAHLAFNDPPADFAIEDPFIIVDLDEACRRQQYGEGWFDKLDDVPRQAISMSIRQILKSKHLIVSVPDLRKAEAVKCAIEGTVHPECPASILQEHPNCHLYLDNASSSLLSNARN
ncbi:MAG: glucosamine-6-phosphate deaminase [Saprospiraceae bacterium]|nr:glucosamine-6-phosphate deaminase [Saprospiraceae bacterium]